MPKREDRLTRANYTNLLALILARGGGGTVTTVTGTAPVTSSGGTTPNIAIDVAGQTEGDLFYFDGTKWNRIPAGPMNFVLTSQGPGLPPIYVAPSGGGVASVTASSPIASSGGANPNITFFITGQTEGDVVYFDGTDWVRLPAGTPNQVLTTDGTGGPPSWTTPSGSTNGIYNYTGLNPVSVGDAATITAADTVGPAKANSPTTFAIGFVSQLLAGNHCVVQYIGELAAFGGLVAGTRYFLDAAVSGGITATAPSSSGDIVESVGVARNTTTLVIAVEEDFTQL